MGKIYPPVFEKSCDFNIFASRKQKQKNERAVFFAQVLHGF